MWPKLGEIPFIGFQDMVFTRFSGCTDPLMHSSTHAFTHSRMDRPEYRVPPANEKQKQPEVTNEKLAMDTADEGRPGGGRLVRAVLSAHWLSVLSAP